jgi:6-phosphogluconolactonase
MVFSPDGRFAYLLHELKNYVAVYEYSVSEKGFPVFELIERVSTVTKKDTKKNAAVALKFSPDSKHMFVSNAGDNSIAVYRRNEETGRLTILSELPVSGEYPKDIAVFPNGEHLVSMNHETNEMTFFAIDYVKGTLVMYGKPVPVETANCGIIVRIS